MTLMSRMALALVAVLGFTVLLVAQPRTTTASAPDISKAPQSSASSSLVAKDIISEVGIWPVANVYTWGDAAVADFDRDGDNDILLTRHNRDTWQLFAFDKSERKYEVVWKIPLSDKHTCDWGDPNRDDRHDLFCTVGADQGHGFGPDELWIQRVDGSFVNRAHAWGVEDPAGRGRDATFLDVNADGWEDIFVGNEPGRDDDLPSANRLYINTGNYTFREAAAEYSMSRTDGGACVATADVNNDSFIDMYVCGQVNQWTASSTGGHLYINDKGKRFIDRTDAAGLAGVKPNDVEFADFDNDGDADLALAQATSYEIRRNSGGDFSATMHGRSTSSAVRDLASGDVDADNDIDLYVMLKHRDRLMINEGSAWAELEVPHATSGLSEAATMIPDWDGHGRAAVYVGNGSLTKPGPRQFIVVESTNPGADPSPTDSITLPGRIEAERYKQGGEGLAFHDLTPGNAGQAYREDDVDIQKTKDNSGAYNVGWIAAHEWTAYDVTAADDLTVAFNVRVASPYRDKRFYLELDGVNITGSIVVPQTGGWQKWDMVASGPVSISSGHHVLKLVAETDGFNVNYADVIKIIDTATIQRIEAEDYRKNAFHDTTAGNIGGAYRSDDVDIQVTKDDRGDFNVGWIASGEWLAYDVNIDVTGDYAFGIRVASPSSGKSFHIEIDGANVTGSIGAPNTGSWQTWANVVSERVFLPAGAHTLTVVAETNGFNINYIDVIPQ